jgi:activator of 2-hydroxyglutaryl-CoA dehydratase
MITAGIACGAKNTKTIIMHDSEIVAKSNSTLANIWQER